MAIDIKTLIQQARTAPRVLRIIAAIVAIDIVVLLFAMFLLDDSVGDRADKISQLKSDLASVQQKAQSTRAEIGRLPELRKLYDQAIANGVLAGQDRLKFVNLTQDLAKDHRLSDFRFKLAPEAVSPLPGGKYQLTSTDVSLEDTALLDGDVFAFWEEVLKRSQAHYEITAATIQRLPNDVSSILPNIKSGAPAALLKAELKFRWQSMRVPVVADKTALSASAAAPSAATPAPVAAPVPAARGTNQ